ncbi:hypothetical protein [Veillonella sp.]|uniref:hypothetical protein n=1 Tax=Veillonella sp. TaxID=1926307 RepID=UPI0025D1E408|nr:hypothetical protein [Veillonella sp.]
MSYNRITKDNFTKLKQLFKCANKRFLERNKSLFSDDVSERCLCGALMIELYKELLASNFKGYYVDLEYNRSQEGKVKTIINDEFKVIKINCDLVIHARGEVGEQENLLALEMKKSYRDSGDKDQDRERLICLTKIPYRDVWSDDGQVHPEHVCGYIIGVYYEVDKDNDSISIEYYHCGALINKEKLQIGNL